MPKLTLAQEHAELRDVVVWIGQHATNINLPTDERLLLAQGCFDVAIEHQAAVLLLYEAGMYGSMFALTRVLAEAFVRGSWLLQCATEAELARFKKQGIDKTLGELVKEIEAHPDVTSTALSTFKKDMWVMLNDFTHTGFGQVSRRHSPTEVGANYPEMEIVMHLGLAGALGFIAALYLIGMVDDDALGQAALERMEQYIKRNHA